MQASGAAWTIVRSSWFNQNFSEDFLLDAVLDGDVAFPAGGHRGAVHRRRRHRRRRGRRADRGPARGQLYEVTGPRLLTFADAAAEIAAATGRDVRYVPVSADEFAAGMREQGCPTDRDRLTELFAEVLDGRNASLTDGVQRAPRPRARDFRDYARRRRLPASGPPTQSGCHDDRRLLARADARRRARLRSGCRRVFRVLDVRDARARRDSRAPGVAAMQSINVTVIMP